MTRRTDGRGGDRVRFVHGAALMPLLGFFSVRDNLDASRGETISKIGSPEVSVREDGLRVTVWREGTEVALRWYWCDATRSRAEGLIVGLVES